jgi:hypothetical protein
MPSTMTPDSRVRRTVRRAAALLSLVAVVASMVVGVTGGIRVTIAGHLVRSTDLVRPLVLAVVAFAVFLSAGGRIGDVVWWARRLVGADHRVHAGLLAAVVLVVGVSYNSTAAGGADAYGYVSEADLWMHGWPMIDQPWIRDVPWPRSDWTFSPLGYRPRDLDGGSTVLVPVYAPGLSLLMAVGKSVGGQEGVFWIVPISGALLVLATYAIGRRLSSSAAGLSGAWLVATSPVVIFLLMSSMNDVPTAAAWAWAFYFLAGRTAASAAAAGLAAGVAILIRPNLVFLAGILGLWYVLRLRHGGAAERMRTVGHGALFSAGAAAGAVAIAVINQHLYGSPFMSGYGTLDGMFAADHIVPNARHYASWFLRWQTPVALLGWAAMFVPLRRLWPAARDRAMFVVIALFVVALWITYLFYLVFDQWWYLRFMLASWPLLFVGVGAAVAWAWRVSAPFARAIVVAGLIALGVIQVVAVERAGAFDIWRGERRYPSAALQVRSRTPVNSIFLSMQHSGSMRYYGGRMTMRYDTLPGHWLDEATAWFVAHGVHPYLLIDRDELPSVRTRFAGQRTAAALDRPPAFVYEGQQPVLLFDLVADATSLPRRGSPTYRETYEHLRSIRPAPAPGIMWAPVTNSASVASSSGDPWPQDPSR